MATYPAILALEALGLPDGYIDSIDPITHSRKQTRYNHLDLFCCGSLKDGAHDHDPTSPHNTTFPAETIGSHECNDCPDKTSYVIYASNNAFEIPIWIVEFFSEGRKANDSPQYPLVITEELAGELFSLQSHKLPLFLK